MLPSPDFSPQTAPPREGGTRAGTRSAILELLEYECPLPRPRLAALSHLSEATVRRACRELTEEGVLTLRYDSHTTDGRKADPVGFVRYPLLPILEVTDTHMTWRLGDTLCGSVFATVRDRSGFRSPEDDLEVLMGQARAVLKSGVCHLPPGRPLMPPVLLLPALWNETAKHRMTVQVRRALDIRPTAVLTPEEAAAHDLRYHPLTQSRDSVLFLREGDAPHASLLVRQDQANLQSPLVAAPYADGLTAELCSRLSPHPIGTAPRAQALADFLRDLCHYIRPGCIVLEHHRPADSLPSPITALPPSIPLLLTETALNTPSLSHKGALRIARRALWDAMSRKQC